MNAGKANPDVLRMVKLHIKNGTLLLAKHAIDRQKERGIRLPEVLYVLERGRHEREKDLYSVKKQLWKHAIRGKTIDGLDLRVIVAFDKKMVIITVIRIN